MLSPQPKTSNRHKFLLSLPRSHFEELREVAGYEDRSVASLIRQLIVVFLNDRSILYREVNMDLASERHKFQMYLDKENFDTLQAVSGYTDRSVASIIRQIVAVFLCDRKANGKTGGK